MQTALLPEPGIFREGTQYLAEGRWYDCNGIRWRKGLPEQVGGWAHLLNGSFLGSGRKLHDWATVDGMKYIGLGTTLKLYVHDGGNYYDITPLSQAQITLGAAPLETTNGSPIVTITTPSAHGATTGDYVTLAGAATTNNIADTVLNAEHRVAAVPSSTTIQIVVNAVADASSTGGGSSCTLETQINRGLDFYTSSTGWGAGAWSEGSWGGSATLSPANQLRLWSIDNYGDDMVACVRNGGAYYWDESSGTSVRAVAFPDLPRRTVTLDTDPIATTYNSNVITITDFAMHGANVGDEVTISGATSIGTLAAGEINGTRTITTVPTDYTYTVVAGATQGTDPGPTGGGAAVQVAYVGGDYSAPLVAAQVMTSPVARHVIAFGTNPRGATDPDPLMVRWSTSENPADWYPTTENTAGGQRISAGSVFVGAIRTRQEILIWTDVGISSMRYVGYPDVFVLNEIETGLSMIAPNAAVNAGGVTFFMDRGGFYGYDGSVRRIPCTVRDYVFSDLDAENAYKIHAGANIDHSEVMWYYPSLSGGTGEIDRYVKYNYDENLWDFGTLKRGAWSNAHTQEYPLATTMRRISLGVDALAINTDTTLIVTAANHGLAAGDTVILSGLNAISNLDELVVNAQWTVDSVTDANTFTIELPVAANSNDTGGGSTGVLVVPDVILSHEYGFDDEGSLMDSYIESGDMDIEDGHHFWFITSVIPDMTFRGTTDPMATVRLKLKTRDYPFESQGTQVSQQITPSTVQNYVRLRARQMAIRVEADAQGYGWRMGKLRMNVRQDGRR